MNITSHLTNWRTVKYFNGSVPVPPGFRWLATGTDGTVIAFELIPGPLTNGRRSHEQGSAVEAASAGITASGLAWKDTLVAV